jgi:RNA polymerase sigma-70 factor, ECF subfamily
MTSALGPPRHAELEGAATQLDFSALVRAEFESVWRLLRRIGVSMADADDGTQQVFLVVARKWDELPASRTRTFLYGTAVRVAANLRRKVKRRNEVSDERSIAALAREATQPEVLERQRACALLDELLERLAPDLRRVFVMAEIERFTAAAIAEIEGIPPGTAASRLRRARAQFYELLEQEQHRNPFQETLP